MVERALPAWPLSLSVTGTPVSVNLIVWIDGQGGAPVSTSWPSGVDQSGKPGPCLAVNLNDRQDYFGQTVNIASRVQELAKGDSIFATQASVRHADAARLPASRGVDAEAQKVTLRGIGDRMPVFAMT
jgi:hypothetical protein